jgi:hypothetical protein
MLVRQPIYRACNVPSLFFLASLPKHRGRGWKSRNGNIRSGCAGCRSLMKGELPRIAANSGAIRRLKTGETVIELAEITALVEEIRGCTFASLDAETAPSPGVTKIVTGESVLLFNCGYSGYEAMVKRRLLAIGKEPGNFSLGDLPWGTRLGSSPLIEHKGRYYLQAVKLRDGDARCFIGSNEIDCALLPKKRTNQGLIDEVQVRAYSLDSITRLTLLKTTLGVNFE